MITITSSPIRFERFQGMFVVTALNLATEAGEHVGSMHQAESRVSFADAKRQFWASWRAGMPGHFLKPRHDA